MFNKTDYSDIIHLEHPTSSKHPRMSMLDRAAQFSPFAALNGHSDAIDETTRRVDHKIELSDDELRILNEKLNILIENLKLHQEVIITYFVPDDVKLGGTYFTRSAFIKKFDEHLHLLVMEDGYEIIIDNILNIDSQLLNNYRF